MRVERYRSSSHYDGLYEALKGWGIVSPIQPAQISFVGFVALTDANVPAAWAFIRRIEGSFGQLDGLTSNPSLPGDIRDQAIDAVVTRLIEEAKAMELHNLTAFSVDKNTLSRSRKYGFTSVPHTVIVLELKG